MSLNNVEDFPHKEEDCKVIILKYIPVSKTKDSFATYDPDSDIVSVNTVEGYLHISNGGICAGGIKDRAFSLAFDLSVDNDFEYLEALFVRYFSRLDNKLDLVNDIDLIDADVKLSTSTEKLYDTVQFFHNEKRDKLFIKLSDEKPEKHIRACRNMVLGINRESELVGIWVQDIVEDPGYKLMHKWLRSYPGDFVIFQEEDK